MALLAFFLYLTLPLKKARGDFDPERLKIEIIPCVLSPENALLWNTIWAGVALALGYLLWTFFCK